MFTDFYGLWAVYKFKKNLTTCKNCDILLFACEYGLVAQLGERCVRNAEVEGSIPFRSTMKKSVLKNFSTLFFSGINFLTKFDIYTLYAIYLRYDMLPYGNGRKRVYRLKLVHLTHSILTYYPFPQNSC